MAPVTSIDDISVNPESKVRRVGGGEEIDKSLQRLESELE